MTSLHHREEDNNLTAGIFREEVKFVSTKALGRDDLKVIRSILEILASTLFQRRAGVLLENLIGSTKTKSNRGGGLNFEKA
jgi:hypothetical protein